MPRAKRLIRKRWTEGTDVLDYELERSLLLGRGCIGTATQLRTLNDWKRHWSRWHDTILPKALEHRPGLRPFAMYVVGEIPARPVLREPPTERYYFKLYVPGDNGTGTWHCKYPEPWMQSEVMYLRDLGIVDAKEHSRYRKWMGTPNDDCDTCAVDSYPDEQGMYQ
jgi:hypothetical protein